MIEIVGIMVGALVPTFLISRALLWAMKSAGDTALRIWGAHIGSFIISVILGVLGFASTMPGREVMIVLFYLIPQMVWLVFDLVRLRGRRAPPAARD